MKIFSYLLLLLIASLHISCGNTRERNTRTATIPAYGTLTVDRASIDFHSYGEGDLTLLFVHGWCIDQTYWSHQVEAFSTENRVVTVDLPGFGQSESNRANSTIEAYGDDIIAVIDQLKLTNVVLIGHSMSGDVVLESALKQPSIIALIGVDNFKEVGVEYTDELRAQIDGFISMLKQNFSATASAFAEKALFHSSTDSLVRARVIADFADCHPTMGVSSLGNLFAYGEKEPKQLSSITQKLYLINSDASPTNIDGLSKTGIAYEVLPISASGHYPMIEKPEEFNRLLREVLVKIKATRSYR